MIYVLYRSKGVLSGRALRNRLKELTKTKVLGGFPSRFSEISAKEGEPSLLINLGSTEEIPGSLRVLNTPDMVRAASNKREARKTFQERGISAPPLFLDPNEITKEDLPVIGRTSHHAKGQGFWYCKTLAQVKKASSAGATHFLGFIGDTREYRVHTFIKLKARKKEQDKRTAEDYASIKISEKVWTGEGKPDPNSPQKNHQFGWNFLGQQNRREEELDVVRHAAKEAVAALGMDFGAADVMFQIGSKIPYVLEVNSTPSLADETADTCERYAARIMNLVPKEERI